MVSPSVVSHRQVDVVTPMPTRTWTIVDEVDVVDDVRWTRRRGGTDRQQHADGSGRRNRASGRERDEGNAPAQHRGITCRFVLASMILYW